MAPMFLNIMTPAFFFFFWHERVKIYHKSIKYYSQELIKLVLEEKKQVYLLYIHERSPLLTAREKKILVISYGSLKYSKKVLKSKSDSPSIDAHWSS